MKKRMASVLVWLAAFCASGVASAFTPVGGLWGFTEELNGKPGRGFQLVVENDVLVFYYYGYDGDGRSNYLFASGPLTANTFSGQLLSCKGGTVIGSPYRQASCVNGPGTVRLTFQSGEKGTIILPGEVPKPINRFNFGYADGPDALLGEFLFAYKGSTVSFSEFYTLTKKTGVTTDYGNGHGSGIVMNAAGTFACEYAAVATGWRDVYLCGELTGSDYDDIYVFRMVGDRGTGIGLWYSSSTVYPLQVLRVATAKSTRTGPYDEKGDVLMKPKQAPGEVRQASADSSVQAKQMEALEPAQVDELPGDFTQEDRAYFLAWAQALRATVRGHQPKK